MTEEFFVFQPCKTTAAFQGTLKKQIDLNMDNVKDILEKEGYEIKLSISDLVIAKKEYTVHIFKNSKVMVKDVSNENQAKKIILSIYEKIIK